MNYGSDGDTKVSRVQFFFSFIVDQRWNYLYFLYCCGYFVPYVKMCKKYSQPLFEDEDDRVATAQGKQGKQGIWMFIFPDRENTGNLPKNIKNMILHREIASNTGKILKF